jgi:hypothetical protein
MCTPTAVCVENPDSKNVQFGCTVFRFTLIYFEFESKLILHCLHQRVSNHLQIIVRCLLILQGLQQAKIEEKNDGFLTMPFRDIINISNMGLDDETLAQYEEYVRTSKIRK